METLTLTKYFSELITADVYSSMGLQLVNPISLAQSETDSANELYFELLRRIRAFERSYGKYFEELLNQIHLTDVNFGRQYLEGVDGILQTFGEQFTTTVAVVLMVYFTIVLKNSLKRNFLHLTPSLIEWNLRIFRKHLSDFVKIGGWDHTLRMKPVLKQAGKRDTSWYSVIKIGVVLTMTIYLFRVIAK